MKQAEERIITDGTDIYVYYELIRQADPQSILDIGMFLKRCGAVSRQVMGQEISRQVCLDGVMFLEETDFLIYHAVYDTIYPNLQAAAESGKRYEVSTLFHVNEYLSAEEKYGLWKFLSEKTDILLADTADAEFLSFAAANFKSDGITVDGKLYARIDFRKS